MVIPADADADGKDGGSSPLPFVIGGVVVVLVAVGGFCIWKKK